MWPRLGLAGALGAVALLGWVKFAPGPESEPAIVAVKDPAPKASNEGLVIGPVTVEQVQALTAKIEDPLEKELRLVLSDTKNAIRFVASNFMPEN